MRTLAFIVTAGLLITAGSLAALAVAASEGSAARPLLRVSDQTPFTVEGRHFLARERVTVTLYRNGRSVRTRRLMTSAAGAFRTALSETVDRCDRIMIRAAGARGSTAQLKLLPLPACHST
jgi:hypothetical protein